MRVCLVIGTNNQYYHCQQPLFSERAKVSRPKALPEGAQRGWHRPGHRRHRRRGQAERVRPEFSQHLHVSRRF